MKVNSGVGINFSQRRITMEYWDVKRISPKPKPLQLLGVSHLRSSDLLIKHKEKENQRGSNSNLLTNSFSGVGCSSSSLEKKQPTLARLPRKTDIVEIQACLVQVKMATGQIPSKKFKTNIAKKLFELNNQEKQTMDFRKKVYVMSKFYKESLKARFERACNNKGSKKSKKATEESGSTANLSLTMTASRLKEMHEICSTDNKKSTSSLHSLNNSISNSIVLEKKEKLDEYQCGRRVIQRVVSHSPEGVTENAAKIPKITDSLSKLIAACSARNNKYSTSNDKSFSSTGNSNQLKLTIPKVGQSQGNGINSPRSRAHNEDKRWHSPVILARNADKTDSSFTSEEQVQIKTPILIKRLKVPTLLTSDNFHDIYTKQALEKNKHSRHTKLNLTTVIDPGSDESRSRRGKSIEPPSPQHRSSIQAKPTVGPNPRLLARPTALSKKALSSSQLNLSAFKKPPQHHSPPSNPVYPR